MPASTEKKRSGGVRKADTPGLTPMAMPNGMAANSASTVPTSTRIRLAPIWVSSDPSRMPSIPARITESKCGKSRGLTSR